MRIWRAFLTKNNDLRRMLASKQDSLNFITSNWKSTYDNRQFPQARRRSKKCAFAPGYREHGLRPTITTSWER
jgi:hypothetical protein